MPSTSRPITDPRQIQTVCAALILANAVYVIVCIVLHLSHSLPAENQQIFEAGQEQMVTYALLAAGVGAIGLSFLLRTVLRGRLNPPVTMPRIATACIVPTALAESAGAIGLVVALLTANWPIAGLLWAIGIGAGILHFPTRSWIDSLTDH